MTAVAPAARAFWHDLARPASMYAPGGERVGFGVRPGHSGCRERRSEQPPPKRRKVTGSTPVPTTHDDRPTGWSSAVWARNRARSRVASRGRSRPLVTAAGRAFIARAPAGSRALANWRNSAAHLLSRASASNRWVQPAGRDDGTREPAPQKCTVRALSSWRCGLWSDVSHLGGCCHRPWISVIGQGMDAGRPPVELDRPLRVLADRSFQVARFDAKCPAQMRPAYIGPL
jgi:hypothetical protein